MRQRVGSGDLLDIVFFSQAFSVQNALEKVDLTSSELKNVTRFSQRISTLLPAITTPYLFFADGNFDFFEADVNFTHMIAEAEAQMADVIAGSFVDEDGKWRQSCLHTHLQNYTLDVWTGKGSSYSSFI